MHPARPVGENAADNESRDRERVWEEHRKTLKKIEPVRGTGLDNSRCHAGKPFCSGVFEYAGTRGLSCIDVLLSAGSANKTKGDRYMGR